jgi:hypothetical protein
MRPDDRCGEFMRALLYLQRWTGLRISDATMASRSRLQGDRYTLKMIKGGKPLTVILPQHVVDALNALPTKDGTNPNVLFLFRSVEEQITHQHIPEKIARLNDYLSLSITTKKTLSRSGSISTSAGIRLRLSTCSLEPPSRRYTGCLAIDRSK